LKYHETKVKVRFNEIDAYQVAWHGHYLVWMEIGRNDLAGQHGLDAVQLVAEGFLAPVVALELKFLRSARFNDELTISTSVRRSPTATLQFVTIITGRDGKKCATGTTTHALTDLQGLLQFRLSGAIAERIEHMMTCLEV
jgi:acyl-CoA thioester hydrolase